MDFTCVTRPERPSIARSVYRPEPRIGHQFKAQFRLLPARNVRNVRKCCNHWGNVEFIAPEMFVTSHYLNTICVRMFSCRQNGAEKAGVQRSRSIVWLLQSTMAPCTTFVPTAKVKSPGAVSICNRFRLPGSSTGRNWGTGKPLPLFGDFNSDRAPYLRADLCCSPRHRWSHFGFLSLFAN